MAYTSEIEKLEQRWKESPQSTRFAPLADAYRKAGDVPRALEVLKQGLLVHPEYVPASIVLGRCQLDAGDLALAEAAFQRVLELDRENVIAVKALADLSERQARFDETEHWLNYLLSIDGNNDEARDQLAHLSELRAQAASMPPVTEPEAEPEPAAAEVTEADTMEVAPVPPSAALPDVRERTREILSVPVSESHTAPMARHSEPEPVSEPEPELEPAFAPPSAAPEFEIVREEGEDMLSGAYDATDLEASEPSAAAADLGVSVDREEDIQLRPSSASEFQVASDAETLASRQSEEEEVLPPFEEDAASPASEYIDLPASPAAPPVEEVSPYASRSFVTEDAAAAAHAPVAEPDPVVTETMGDVYATQGLRAEALMVYREVLSRMPGDQRLQEKIARLEGPTRAREPEPLPKAYAAAATGGQSVRQFFGVLLTVALEGAKPAAAPSTADAPATPAPATPPSMMDEAFGGEADPSATGEPTRPASQPLSLSAIFGEDSSPIPPVISQEPAQPATPKKAGGISFGEFFGEPSSATEERRSRSARVSQSDPDDLDQFHKWLKSLKS